MTTKALAPTAFIVVSLQHPRGKTCSLADTGRGPCAQQQSGEGLRLLVNQETGESASFCPAHAADICHDHHLESLPASKDVIVRERTDSDTPFCFTPSDEGKLHPIQHKASLVVRHAHGRQGDGIACCAKDLLLAIAKAEVVAPSAPPMIVEPALAMEKKFSRTRRARNPKRDAVLA